MLRRSPQDVTNGVGSVFCFWFVYGFYRPLQERQNEIKLTISLPMSLRGNARQIAIP